MRSNDSDCKPYDVLDVQLLCGSVNTRSTVQLLYGTCNSAAKLRVRWSSYSSKFQGQMM